jgi:hypothetical protein
MSPQHPEDEVVRVAEMIRSYLRAHPRAADTAQGIQRWWIAPVFGEVSLRAVEEALLTLERSGAVQKLDPLMPQSAYARGPRFADG